MLQEIAQWALLPILALSLYCFWRLDESRRASERIQTAQRRAVARLNRAITRTQQIDNQRAEINNRYDDTVARIRQVWQLDKEG